MQGGHQLQLRLPFPLSLRSHAFPDYGDVPATSHRFSMESTLRNSSSHRSGVAWGPGDSSRWWPVTQSVPRSGGISGPRRSSAWAWPVRISSENSIPPAVGLGPGRRTDSRSVRRGERGLRNGQELAGQLATPAGQLLVKEAPWRKESHSFTGISPSYFQHFLVKTPGLEPVKETSISPSVKWGEYSCLSPLPPAWAAGGTHIFGFFNCGVLALSPIKKK